MPSGLKEAVFDLGALIASALIILLVMRWLERRLKKKSPDSISGM